MFKNKNKILNSGAPPICPHKLASPPQMPHWVDPSKCPNDTICPKCHLIARLHQNAQKGHFFPKKSGGSAPNNPLPSPAHLLRLPTCFACPDAPSIPAIPPTHYAPIGHQNYAPIGFSEVGSTVSDSLIEGGGGGDER